MRELPLVLPDWPAPGNVRAAASTRDGGVSGGPYASLNLGTHVEDAPDAVAANRRLLRGRLGLRREPAWLDQVHGNRVVRADEMTGTTAADASWTDRPGLACAVMVADCLPVLFCDRKGTRVAAAHGGWRGLAGGILDEVIAAMGLPPSELMAWLGPAIGPDAFEVGPEVRETFLARWPETAAAFRRGREDRWLCDIFRVARVQLRELGVTDIHGGGFCTVNDERFYSFRRDGVTGRMAGLVWLDAGQ